MAPPPRSERPPAVPLADRESASALTRWLAHYIVPLGGSLTLHAALIAALTIATWQVLERRAPERPPREVGIVGAETGTGFAWEAPPSLSAGDQVFGGHDAGEAMTFGALGEAAEGTGGLAGWTEGEETGGGFGVGDAGLSGLLGIGGGAGDGGDTGFGSGIGGDEGVGQAGVWSLSARGHKFVYVVDFSGSITLMVDELKHELKRSIGKLGPSQSFNVVLFYSVADPRQEEFRYESFAATLQPATPRSKRAFFDWIDGKRPMGQTRPAPAVRRALSYEPEVVFFFSDGAFEDAEAEEMIAASAGRVRLYCLAFDEFLFEDASGLPAQATRSVQRLERIARETGGQSKVVTMVDVGP